MSPALFAPALRPDPGTAQDWVRAELAERPYQPSLLERITDWFWGVLDRAVGAAQHVGRLSPAVALVVLVALLAGIALVLSRIRRDPRGHRTDRVLVEDARATAQEYRERAARARAEERWDDVVVDAMRALALSLVERALLDDLTSRTAREVGLAAALAFPAYGDRLNDAARLFDDVRYGGRHATRDRAAEVLAVEEAVRHARPGTEPGVDSTLVVPR